MKMVFLLILSSALLAGCGGGGGNDTAQTSLQTQASAKITLDAFTSNIVDTVLEDRARSNPLDKGQTIEFISRRFLGVPYRDNMLQGTINVPEQLVIDFRGLDCFTYLDYVEALRRSTSQSDFVNNLIETRYVDGKVDFLNRKHFFTDWAHGKPPHLADDITTQISPDTVTVAKNLNRRFDDSAFLPGLPVVQRNITYIPTGLVTQAVVDRLQTGDYIGIYARAAGLDVTHVGFFVRTESGVFLRNASSRPENQKVVDSPFMEYVARTPGIIVFRPKD